MGVQDLKHSNSVIRRMEDGVRREACPKHLGNLDNEYRMQQRSAAPTPITRDGSDMLRFATGGVGPGRARQHVP